jgi:hypothetical protein
MQWVRGPVMEVQGPRIEFNFSAPCSAEIKHECSHTSTPLNYAGKTGEISFYVSDIFRKLELCLSSGSGTARHLLM